MRGTAIVVFLLLGFTCTAFAQGEIFSDDFESGLPFAWSSLFSWMPSVEIEPDFAGLTSQYVKPEDGSTITAVGSDGTEYRLTIPANALAKPAVIIMTPIAAIPNLPLTDGLGAGVELLPDGLTFFKPVTLEITPSAGSVPDTAIGFAFHEGGEGFHLYPHVEESGTVTIPITAFSGYGFGFSTALDLSPLSNILGVLEDAYLNEIAHTLAKIRQDGIADPADVAKIERALKNWHEDVVMTTADAISVLAAQCGANMAELLATATNKRLKWEVTVELLAGHVDPVSDFGAEDTAWSAKETSFCNQINTCDDKCGDEEKICDNFAKIPGLLEVQRNLDVLGLGCGIIGQDVMCQGLARYFSPTGIDMQCGAKIPIDGSTQIVATPQSILGYDVGKAHLSNPGGGSPIEWTVGDPSIASLVGATDELAVTVAGVEKGEALVGVTLTQCERTVVGGCVVEVGEPLRVRIDGCDWNSTSCHLPSLAGGSTTVDVEALFDGAEPTDEIQIAVQPYRPLDGIDVAPVAGSCTQYTGAWGGFGCAGVAAPGERFTAQITGLGPEFPVFAVHVTAHFEGAVQEAVAWAYSTDICHSEADLWYDFATGSFSAPTAEGSAEEYLLELGYVAPDSIEVEIRSLSAVATCSPGSYVHSIAAWWDTLLVVPKDLRLFDHLLEAEGTMEIPIVGAASAVARAGQCVDGWYWVSAASSAVGWAETWSWEVIPSETPGVLGFNASDSCTGEPWFETHEIDRIVHPHVFGKPTRLIGLGQVSCIISHVAPGYGHVSGSATWDVVTAATWEGDYLSLHDFRIFSCSGEFDLNWPP